MAHPRFESRRDFEWRLRGPMLRADRERSGEARRGYLEALQEVYVAGTVRRILEVNLAVRHLEDAMTRFNAMGLSDVGIWNVEHPPVETRTTSFPIADSNLSLVEPLVDRDPVARFLDKYGEGIFSLTLLVDGIRDLMDRWRQAGVDFVLPEPLEMRDVRIVGRHIPWLLENWTRPSTLHGTVIELQDHRNADGSPYSPTADQAK